MKILWVKSGGLLPLDAGGKTRSFNILRELARRNETSLFTFYPYIADDQHRQLKQFLAQLIALPLQIPAPGSVGDYWAYGRNLFSRRPYSVAKDCLPAVARELFDHLRTNAYDVLVCDYVHTAGVLPESPPCPVVVFTHNVEAQIWQRHYQVSRNPIWKAVAWREYRTMDRFERRALEHADFVLTVSENDRQSFARWLDPQKIASIPTGVDTEYFSPSGQPEEPTSLVFTGSMDWRPNEDAIQYFAQNILPLVRREIPDVSLWVVGRTPTAALLHLGATEKAIHVTGTVDDVRPFIARAAVYVVPLRIGGGTRIKIFEAMGMGKAIVSTTLGAEGLPVEHGKNILLADAPDEFAGHVVGLLGDSQARQTLGRNARRLVEERFSWSAVTDHFEHALERAVERSRSHTAGERGSSN